MNETSRHSTLLTSTDTPSAISSPESADGATPSDSLAGPMIDLFGRAVAPVSPLVVRESLGGGGDSRHLWPTWYHLIRECHPPVVFGEQVAAAIGHGWLDLVCDDLERQNYAVGAVGLPAGAFGAAHVRQRIWWVADTDGVRLPRPWQCQQPRGSSSQAFREADQFGDAVQRDALPFLCLSHDGISTQLAQGFLRGYGNAIVPQVAAAFINAYQGVNR